MLQQCFSVLRFLVQIIKILLVHASLEYRLIIRYGLQEIIREYGQRRLRETEEHRKMVKSVPNSPQPGAEKRASQNEKKSDSTNHCFHMPQLKYIQRLPAVSPRLKRVLSLKNSLKCSRNKRKIARRKSSDERQIALALETLHRNMNNRLDNDLNREFDDEINETEDTDFSRSGNAVSFGHSLAVPSLNVIAETSSASDTESDETNEASHKRKRANTLADVVIKLLRKKKQEHGYTPVDTDYDDTDNQLNNIKIANISDVVSCANKINDSVDSKKLGSDSAEKHSNISGITRDLSADSNKFETDKCDHSTKQVLRPEVPKSLAVPKIVLSRDTNMSSR